MRRIEATTRALRALILASVFVASNASATLIELTARPTTGDTVNWSQIGAPGTTFATPTNFTSVGGITGSATLNQNSTGQIFEQCCIGLNGTWDGNFAAGDILFYTQQSGPLTITFDSPVQSVGAQIGANPFGPFTAEIQAYHQGALLGTFTETGNETTTFDNTAIFLGVSDAHPDITKVVFSLTASSGPLLGDFAINRLTIELRAVPEPGSLLLFSIALLGLAVITGILKAKTRARRPLQPPRLLAILNRR